MREGAAIYIVSQRRPRRHPMNQPRLHLRGRRRNAPQFAIHRAAVETLESRTLLDATLIKDINPALSTTGTPQYLCDVNGTVYFNTQFKLWKTNGTSAGTV